MNGLIGGKLIGQGTYGCVYYPGIDCRGKRMNDTKLITKLQVYDDVFVRELMVSNIIRGIDKFDDYFVPMTKSCAVNFDLVNKNISDIKDCNVVQKRKKRSDYVLTQEQYIKGHNLHTLVGNFIKNDNITYEQVNQIYEKLLFFYSYLSKSVELLTNHNIIHYDLKGDNIMIKYSSTAVSHNIPYIIDFGMSFHITDIINMLTRGNASNILQYLKQYFFTYATDVEYWPLEVHIICYILHSKDLEKKRLDMEKINLVIQSIINNNKVLKKCSEKYIKEFEEQSTKFMEGVIHKNKTNIDIIKKLISYYKSWNQYALDSMILHTMNKIKKSSSDLVYHKSKSLKRVHKSKHSNRSRKSKLRHIDEFNNLRQKLLTNIGINHRSKQFVKLF